MFYEIENIEEFANRRESKILWFNFLQFLENEERAGLSKLTHEFYVIFDNKKMKNLVKDNARGIPFHITFHEALRGEIYKGHGQLGRASGHFRKESGIWPQEYIEQLTNDGLMVVTIAPKSKIYVEYLEALSLHSSNVHIGITYLKNKDCESHLYTVLLENFTLDDVLHLEVLLEYEIVKNLLGTGGSVFYLENIGTNNQNCHPVVAGQ